MIVCVLLFSLLVYASASETSDAFEAADIPDILSLGAPDIKLNVSYLAEELGWDHEQEKFVPVGDPVFTVNLGNIANTEKTVNQPLVEWDGQPYDLYTLIMIDADAPRVQRIKRIKRQGHTLHWLVVDIEDNDVAMGRTIRHYQHPDLLESGGLHRYIILLFKQKHMLTRLQTERASSRIPFDLKRFSDAFDLGDPVAGNFFLGKQIGRNTRKYRLRWMSESDEEK